MATEPGPESPANPQRKQREVAIDRELAQSFPASDPPGWTLGRATYPMPSALSSRPQRYRGVSNNILDAIDDTPVLEIDRG